MMKLFQKILNFILFKSSFEIQSNLDQEMVKKALYSRFKRDSSFINPVIQNNKFAFSHKNIMPKFYIYNPIVFEGEIISKEKTLIFISIKISSDSFWIFVFAIFYIFILYFASLGPLSDEFIDFPYPFNPLFFLFIILIPYFSYAYKTNDVKSIIKSIVKREEKRMHQ